MQLEPIFGLNHKLILVIIGLFLNLRALNSVYASSVESKFVNYLWIGFYYVERKSQENYYFLSEKLENKEGFNPSLKQAFHLYLM